MMPPLVGLKACLPSTRIRNLPAIVRMAARTARSSRFVRSRRQRESPEMRALRGSNRGSFQSLVLGLVHIRSLRISVATRLVRRRLPLLREGRYRG
jgi:transcriptional regulator of nitric oxide reductase